ncbi:MAG: UDP-N-acetylglucosamine 2-epimerase (non-hydrolyzing) [Bacteroidales bacterium]
MKILSVVGARPNFMKIAPFVKVINNHNNNNPDYKITHTLVHTGQHYDFRMSDNFFHDLGIPEPEINLGVGSGTHAEQVGNTMIEFEKVLHKKRPDWVVVVGDVNATLACSVTAKKEIIKCCHIEAGLRSGDMTMPEEINRIVTDRVSDLLLAPDQISVNNLLSEGVPENRIVMTGNIMIDTFDTNIGRAKELNINNIIAGNLATALNKIPTLKENEPFAFVTLHRPSNVDDLNILSSITEFLSKEAARELIIIWSVHPRTEKNLKKFKLWDSLAENKNMILLHPISYTETLKLNLSARLIMTDSGGLQEESTVLGTPCITLRNNTERPVTLRQNGGTSVLAGNNPEIIKKEFYNALTMERKPFRPPLWDGHAAERCLKAILEYQT